MAISRYIMTIARYSRGAITRLELLIQRNRICANTQLSHSSSQSDGSVHHAIIMPLTSPLSCRCPGRNWFPRNPIRLRIYF